MTETMAQFTGDRAADDETTPTTSPTAAPRATPTTTPLTAPVTAKITPQMEPLPCPQSNDSTPGQNLADSMNVAQREPTHSIPKYSIPKHSVSCAIPCAIALGGNLGDVAATFERALAALDATPGIQVTGRSRWYRNPPMGPPQPDFLNGCALLKVALSPKALLDRLQALENEAGRVRTVHWGPRTLDLDLLLYGDRVVQTPRLQVPHPGLGDRAFFVVPLAEIAPDWVEPLTGRAIAQIAQTLDCSAVIPLA
jgi:2-amino-4-hydroxy-6-hydroxymethyldihydropteridine diphosphokinase